MKFIVSTKRIIFPGLFITLLLPTLLWMIKVPDMQTSENRSLAKFPAISLNRDDIEKFPADFESYLNDHIPLRNWVIHFRHAILVNIFGWSPVPSVILGKNGWLYYYGDSQPYAYDQFLQLSFFTEDQMQSIASYFQKENDWMIKNNIHFYIVAAPDKESIYPEFLPDTMDAGLQDSSTTQILSYIRQNTNIEVIDLREALIKAKEIYPTYYKSDTHWNNYGAFVAYQEIMGKVCGQIKCGSIKDLTDYTVKIKGIHAQDLAKLLALPEIGDQEVDLIPRFGLDAEIKSTSNDERATITSQVNNTVLPNAVVFDDSFGVRLIPYLSNNFGRATYHWQSYSHEVVEKEHPEIVIYELAERYIRKWK